MTNALGRSDLQIAILSLVVGAAAAPAFYVVAALVVPRGFADFRGESLFVAPIYFVLGWLWSAALTAVVGGLTWRPLHQIGKDGFVTYIGAALLTAFGLSYAFSASLPTWDLLAMAGLNGFAVRVIEERLRARRSDGEKLGTPSQ